MLNSAEIAERDQRKVNRFLMYEPNDELIRRFDELEGASPWISMGVL